MARPKKTRQVGDKPVICNFKPAGIPSVDLETTCLTIDEFEAVRLADYEGLDHEEAALLMNVSRPTFTRLIEKARGRVAEFLVEGKELVIAGGNVEFVNRGRCGRCGKEFTMHQNSQEGEKRDKRYKGHKFQNFTRSKW